jgi:hypothetical protein
MCRVFLSSVPSSHVFPSFLPFFGPFFHLFSHPLFARFPVISFVLLSVLCRTYLAGFRGSVGLRPKYIYRFSKRNYVSERCFLEGQLKATSRKFQCLHSSPDLKTNPLMEIICIYFHKEDTLTLCKYVMI